MTGARIYPAADAKTQWFASVYPGDTMPHPNVLVLHTTEGATWPGYSGGAVAPTWTAFPDVANRRLLWRQHFPANMSARALKNLSGGVETNTLNVVQVELVGTCAKGGPGLYWPDAPDWALADLADFLKWLAAEWPVPLHATPKPWLPYPSSYGTAGGQRMSASEWTAFAGVCGHEHVPENVHGDPGDFPISRVLALATGALTLSEEDDMPTAQEVADAVWARVFTEYVDENGNGTRDPRSTADVLMATHRFAFQANAQATAALAAVKAIADASGTPVDGDAILATVQAEVAKALSGLSITLSTPPAAS